MSMRGISNFSLYSNLNNNYSSLFGSVSGKNSSIEAGFNFLDLATIRNGSYKKLIKAQYAKNKETGNRDRQASLDSNRFTVSKTADKKLQDGVSSLKESVKKLDSQDLWKKQDGEYNVENITGAIKDFAKEYNNVIDQVDQNSSSEVSNSGRWMKSLTNTMKGSLDKVGVRVEENGKLTVDEEALKKSDMKSVKAMFNGTYSYANQTARKAGSVVSASIRGGSVYSGNGRYATVAGSWFSTVI